MSSNGAPASESPIDGPIVEVSGSPRLLGSLCPSCGTHEFPVQRSCAKCGSAMGTAPLPSSGSVWSWTVQRMRPKRLAQTEFAPYTVGYVDLGVVKVEARLSGRAVDSWAIGEPVVLHVPAADDTEAPPYWFSPEVTA